MTRRALTMTAGRRAVFARQATQRFDRAEQEFGPVVEAAIREYLAHLRDVWGQHDATVLSLTAAAGDAAVDKARRAKHGNLTPSEARTRERAVAGFTVEDADEAADVLTAPSKWQQILTDTLMPAYRKMLGPVLQSGLNNPGAKGAVTAWRNQWLEQRTQSLSGIPDQVSSQFRTALRDVAVKNGTSVDDARDIASKMLADGYPSWTSRAQTIARTETVAANNQGSLASFSALADTTGQTATKTWLATPDAKIRETHADADGQTVGIEETFTVGDQDMTGPGDPNADPGETINCFPAGTIVESPSGVVASYRRWYDGPMLSVETASGVQFSATPNHPILTVSGWKPAQLLNDGDELVGAVGGRRAGRGQPPIGHVPTTFGELHRTMSELSPAHRVGGAAMDFHGDGRRGEVEVVRADRNLRVPSEVREQSFGWLRDGLRQLARLGRSLMPSPRGSTQWLGARAARGIGGRGQRPTLLERRRGHANFHRLTPIADGGAAINQSAPDGRAADAEIVRERLLADAFEVSTDKVIGVKVESFHGWVHNLSTMSGWYIANGIIGHNCRCTMTYAFTDPEGDQEGDLSADDIAGGATIPEPASDSLTAATDAPLASPTHAGMAVMAADTGRVVLLQRTLNDPDDPARGQWEFPGGSIEPGEAPRQAAEREWSEETGLNLPAGQDVDGWTSSDGVYAGFIYVLPAETDLSLNPDPPEVANPDGALGPETSAWFFPADLPDMPSLRPVVLNTPWDKLTAAAPPPVDRPGDTDAEPMTAAVEALVTTPAPTTGANPTAATGADPGPAEATGGDTAAPAVDDLTPQGLTWQGPLAMLDTPSSDGRLISSTGGTIRALPQPLNWQRESDDGHDGSTKVGRILAVEQRGNMLWGSGDWLDPMVNFDAQQAMAEVDAGLGFISVDLAVLAEAYATPDGTLIDPDFAPGNPDDVCLAAVEWEFGGATLVSFAAFRDARITNDPVADALLDPTGAPLMPPMPGDGQFAGEDATAPAVNAAGDGVTMPDGTVIKAGDQVNYPDPDDGTQITGTVTAVNAAAETVTLQPPIDDGGTPPPTVDIAVDKLVSDADDGAAGPADAMLTASSELLPYTAANFAQRELDGPTPISYDPATGAVYGHIGQWGTCHVGKLAETGKCVTIPEAPGGDYSQFELTPVHTDDGEMLMAGRLTVGTGHAGPHGGVRAALAHYDNSGAQVALVKTYEDAYGVQVSGQVIHGTPPERIEEMLRSPMSGDWRLVDVKPNAPLRLVAALGVNVPGFPVIPKWGMSRGRQVSLVAAGVVRPPEVAAGLVPLGNGQSVDSGTFDMLVAAVNAAMDRRVTAAAAVTDDADARLRMARAKLALAAR